MSTGVVAWFTGLPSAGKTTLAHEVAGELRLRGIDAVILDGDEVRESIVPPHGYDEASRASFYTTLARLATVIARQGHVVLVPATANRRAYRDAARGMAPAFIEIFVDTPRDELERRDTKGLYAAHNAQAPGVGVEYEPPLAPDIRVAGDAAAVAVGPGEEVAVTIAQRIADLFE